MTEAGKEWTLRLRTPKGVIPFHVSPNNTFYELLETIGNMMNEKPAPNCVMIRGGYPVKEIYTDRLTKISSMDLKNGDILIAQIKPPDAALLPPLKEDTVAKNTVQEPSSSNGEGIILRRVVPADNSCLFTAISKIFHSDLKLREIIAQEILDKTAVYESILDQEPLAYSSWILNKSNWGGAIEIAILSKYFQSEIAVCDIQTGRMDVFGQEEKYIQRGYLLYDGIHYDALVLVFDATQPEDCDVTLFQPKDEYVAQQALKLAAKAKNERQFTDISGFSLRCGVCNKALVGVKQAEEHSRETNHQNFVELK